MIEKFWEYLLFVLFVGWMMEGCSTQESESNILDTLPTDSISYKDEYRNALKSRYINVNQADSVVNNKQNK